ncbi:MAM and LDL-receptor class A domain-containing protein 1-like [Corticium candelabrum]|uniref:MAM and LDL-receptor class A domain-containing protein 1-like n=1 Tax=Corticium candelabrum TaxID=121492 RepID=UPI002E27516B|nr:MAM and LDL-receptor class A domain-containing protein 1-like [Corticium candelabrum]
MTCKLSMAYHMYGSQIGTLEVIAHTTYGNSLLWRRFGNQGNFWLTTTVDFGSINGLFEIYMRASHSSGFRGDIALDDLSLTNCSPDVTQRPCTKNEFTCLQSKLCVETDSLCDLHNDCYDNSDEAHSSCYSAFQCDFEQSMCGFTNDENNDDFDWTLARGSTSSSQTGPETDHTTGDSNGRYIYIEASFPRATGDTAILWSPLFNSSTAANCSVRFFAFMYGQDMGSLVVSQVIGTSWTQLMNISGEQGQDWKKFSLDVPLSGGKKFKLAFEGVRGIDYAGDIALDDLTFSTSCPKPELRTEYPTTDAMTTSTPTAAKRFFDPCFTSD